MSQQRVDTEEHKQQRENEFFVPVEHLHCMDCYQLRCDMIQLCPLINCPHCAIRLHQCKLTDHEENICCRARAACPNAAYGCQVRLRRQFLAAHLTHCSVSIVHCPFIRNRQFISRKAKKILKQTAKGKYQPEFQSFLSNNEIDEEELMVPDVAFARIDQKVLEQFFRTPREWRQSLRPSAIPIHRLTEMSQTTEKLISAQEKDSSDEEQKAIERKHRAIREPFAGCRLCQKDPGSQHLHELGAMRPRASPIEIEGPDEHNNKNVEDENSEGLFDFLPDFYRQRGLLIRLDVPFMSLVIDEHYLHMNYPISSCPAGFVRRDQFNAHYECHMMLDDSAPSAFYSRCPNWQYGCTFRTDARKIRNGGGMIRFNSFIGGCVHEPMPQMPVQSRWPFTVNTNGGASSFAEMPIHFFALLTPYLEDASLSALSVTCRRLHQLLPNVAEHRLRTELIWERQKENGNVVGQPGRNRYVVTGLRRSFAPVHGWNAPPGLIVQPLGAICDHLQHCSYRVVHDLGKEPVDLRKFHGRPLPNND